MGHDEFLRKLEADQTKKYSKEGQLMKLTLKKIWLMLSISNGNHKLGFTPNISGRGTDSCNITQL
jgi:hypothetical protein